MRAGVEVWFYKDRQRFAFGTLGENIVGFVKAEAAAEYRRQIASWTYDAMARKARAGHVAGGRCFGYENVLVDGHVNTETQAGVRASSKFSRSSCDSTPSWQISRTWSHATARFPAVLEALRRRDTDRRRLAAELAALDGAGSAQLRKATDVRATLRSFLDDWHALLDGDSVKSRAILDLVLTDRIRFKPYPQESQYELTIPIAFDRLIVAVVPSLRERLQETMASPPGFEPGFQP